MSGTHDHDVPSVLSTDEINQHYHRGSVHSTNTKEASSLLYRTISELTTFSIPARDFKEAATYEYVTDISIHANLKPWLSTEVCVLLMLPLNLGT